MQITTTGVNFSVHHIYVRKQSLRTRCEYSECERDEKES